MLGCICLLSLQQYICIEFLTVYFNTILEPFFCSSENNVHEKIYSECQIGTVLSSRHDGVVDFFVFSKS